MSFAHGSPPEKEGCTYSEIMKLFRPANSIVLVWDHVDEKERSKFEEQVEEVLRFYPIESLSNIVERLYKRQRQGFAAITFSSARKSIFLRAIPWLNSRKLPFTLFLNPTSIGSNRLPIQEELALYHHYYPERFGEAIFQEWERESWVIPAEGEARIRSLRREIGPLPLNFLDPTRYFATWGEVVRGVKEKSEFGITLSVQPIGDKSFSALEGEKTFVQNQIGQTVRLAFAQRDLGSDLRELRRLGIAGVLLDSQTGPVGRDTDPMKLPRWEMRIK
ncbi:MAG: hypothetical protein HY537_11640 [Deltaproteobacteria bacterium]|nr:hypothetical protein [Deltaproteobacteria bacterium]